MQTIVMRTSHRVSTLALIVAAMGCGGLNSDGGSGGAPGDASMDACIPCSPDCFDCFNTGCRVCEFGGAGGISGSGGIGGNDDDGGLSMIPWTSPFPDTGDEGTWRSTRGLFCGGGGAIESMTLWSDARGVYVVEGGVLASWLLTQMPIERIERGAEQAPIPANSDAGAAGFAGSFGSGGGGGFAMDAGAAGAGGTGFMDDCIIASGSCYGRAIQHNNGTGWRTQVTATETVFGERLSGMPGGELVLYRPFASGSQCGLSTIDGRQERCAHTASGVQVFFAVDAQRAFAAVDRTLLAFDGDTWSVHPTALPFVPTAMWANATDVVIVGDLGRIARLQEGIWIASNRGIERLTSVWGGEGETLWIGTSAGSILRRNAIGTWLEPLRVGGVTCSSVFPIVGMWGAEGVIFAHTDNALVRIDGDEITDIGNWTCAGSGLQRRIRSIWGNSPSELFIAVTDPLRGLNQNIDDCGDGFVLYYDGALVHRL